MLQFECLFFNNLSVFQLYEIMALRQAVFVVEQNCPYVDADGKDLPSWHLLGRQTDGQLVAYARLLPKGVAYPDYPSIGRVLSAPNARGAGLGRLLMETALIESRRLFGDHPVKIGAQLYLLEFYQSLGFFAVGEEYLEDGIPHIAMIRP